MTSLSHAQFYEYQHEPQPVSQHVHHSASSTPQAMLARPAISYEPQHAKPDWLAVRVNYLENRNN